MPQVGAASRLLEEFKDVTDPDVGHPKCPGLSVKSLPSLVTQRPVEEAGVSHLLS